MTEEIRVKCPWCHKGETYVDEDGSGAVTVQCSKCQHCYKVQLKDGSTTKVSARKRTVNKTFEGSGRFTLSTNS